MCLLSKNLRLHPAAGSCPFTQAILLLLFATVSSATDMQIACHKLSSSASIDATGILTSDIVVIVSGTVITASDAELEVL